MFLTNQSAWVMDMGCSYHSWSSRGLAASDQYEQNLLEQHQAMDVEGLSNSWQSDFKSQIQEQGSDARSKLSHVLIQDVVHQHDFVTGRDDRHASSLHGSTVDAVNLDRSMEKDKLFPFLHTPFDYCLEQMLCRMLEVTGGESDRGASLHSSGRSWSADGDARYCIIESESQSFLASAAEKSRWLADDLGSSYRSWSSRGIAASNRYEQQVHEESQVIDVDELRKVSSSQNSWRSDSRSQFHEQNSDILSKRSHDSMRDVVHQHDFGDGMSDDNDVSSAHGIVVNAVDPRRKHQGRGSIAFYTANSTKL